MTLKKVFKGLTCKLPQLTFKGYIHFSSNYEKVVENEGMPILENPEQKGNLKIRFTIEFPKYLPKASKSMLQKGFHLARTGGGYGNHEMINKVVLADKILRVDPGEQLPPI